MTTLSIDYSKFKYNEIRRLISHNKRENKNTESQLDKKHWFSEIPVVSFIDFNEDKLTKAHELSKRKDAIELVSFVIQIGNQTDWREEPTPDFPAGKPKKIDPEKFKGLANELIKTLGEIYGKENLVGCELHLDESSPHFHIYMTPIKDNKLQAKGFISGKGDLIKIRKAISNSVNRIIPCSFTDNSGTGGEKHDENLSAKAKSMLLNLVGKDPKDKEIAELKKQLITQKAEIERHKQALRQQQKTRIKKDSIEKLKAENQQLNKDLIMEKSGRIEAQKIEPLYYELKGNFKSEVNAEVEKAVRIEKDSIRKQQEEAAKEKQQVEAEKRALQSQKQEFDRRTTDDPLKLENRALKGQIEIVTRQRDEWKGSAEAWKAECEAARPERRL